MSGRFPDRVDVAIVGSGPAGAAWARILSERAPELQLAILEAGPLVSSPPGAHVKNIADPEARQEAQRRSQGAAAAGATSASPAGLGTPGAKARPGTELVHPGGASSMPQAAISTNVGGMGAHWTGACPRPGGSERIGGIDEMDELLAEAERLLGVSTSAFEGTPFAAHVRGLLSPVVDGGRPAQARVSPMPLAVHRDAGGTLRWSGADVVFGEETRENPNAQLFADALVTQVVLHDDGRAAGVRVVDRAEGDAEHQIQAGVVVLACDALRTPQLLWASGIRPEALGRNLNDQPQVVYAARVRDAQEVATAAAATGGPLGEAAGVSWIPFTDDQPFHGQVMQLDASPVALADDDPEIPGSIVGLGLFVAKEVRWEDRVEFVDAGPGQLPEMRLDYGLSAADEAAIEAAKTWIKELAQAVGEPLGDAPLVLPAGSSLHYQGTVRLSAEDDGSGVCSPFGEVYGAPGVYVAGNGVIPTSTACNPTLTAVALAVRGARAVASQLTPATSRRNA